MSDPGHTIGASHGETGHECDAECMDNAYKRDIRHTGGSSPEPHMQEFLSGSEDYRKGFVAGQTHERREVTQDLQRMEQYYTDKLNALWNTIRTTDRRVNWAIWFGGVFCGIGLALLARAILIALGSHS